MADNRPSDVLVKIIIAAIVIFLAYCEFNSPSSREQYERDYGKPDYVAPIERYDGE